MELKFQFITFFVLFGAFATIETKRSGGRSRPTSHGTSHGTSFHPSHKTASTGTFLHAERTHSSSGNHHQSSSGSDPYRHASAPPLHHGHHGSNNPLRPFGTVPPPRHTGTSGNQSPFRPFATVPPPTHIGRQNPPTQRPIGFDLPTGRTPIKPTNPPIIHTGHHLGTNVYPKPGSTLGHRNISHPPQSGSYIPHYTTARPVLSGNYNNSRGGGYNPVLPPNHYPTQGSPGGVTYPHQQPPYNPGYPHNQQPSYNPAYPNYHQSLPSQSNPSHIYTQSGHILPPKPSHTVIVVSGQSNNYGSHSRSTGDIFKEALIYSGVNAAVNRVISPSNPYDHFHHHSWNSYGTPPQGSFGTSTNTHIVNNNYYGESPGSPLNTGGGSNLPPYNPTQNYPNGGVPGGTLPSSGTYPIVNNGNSNSQSSTGSAASPGNPALPSNGQSHPIQNGEKEQTESKYNWPGGITDQVLWNITEKLFAMDEPVYKFISINLQNQTARNNTNVTDTSPQPLFSIHPDAYQVPSIQAILTLYDVNLAVENKTRESSRKEEAFFIDSILNTNVMTTAMHFLALRNLIENDYFKHKDFLKHIWFTPYDGSSSGFKRVFQGKASDEQILWGIQDWIAFHFYERYKRANYLSYIEELKLGKNASIVKINYEMSGIMKLGTGILVGTSPELEMALYTICHHARPNYYCNVSLGGTKFNMYTHTFRYFGHDLIDAAFPLI